MKLITSIIRWVLYRIIRYSDVNGRRKKKAIKEINSYLRWLRTFKGHCGALLLAGEIRYRLECYDIPLKQFGLTNYELGALIYASYHRYIATLLSERRKCEESIEKLRIDGIELASDVYVAKVERLGAYCYRLTRLIKHATYEGSKELHDYLVSQGMMHRGGGKMV